MKNIKKIQFGYRYNEAAVLIQECVGPPYDIFNYGDSIDRSLRKYPYNIVHIQKPAGPDKEKYKNAFNTFKDFVRKEILIKEEKPGFYIINQSWENNSRTGLIAAVKLDPDYQRIKRHEKTKPGPIVDRFELTKSTGLNIGSIFVVFDDSGSQIAGILKESAARGRKLYNFNYPENIRSKVTLSENDEIQKILENKKLYIADGHHRYRTMLDYRALMHKQEGNPADSRPYDYTMMFLVPSSEVTILPYHRLIKNTDTEVIKKLIDNLTEDFTVNRKDNLRRPQKGTLGLYLKWGYYELTPRRKSVDLLDSELLQKEILDKRLGISDKDMAEGDFIHFKPGNEDISEIKDSVDSSKYQAAFILNPPSFKNIKRISDENKTMPPKSTYFYPKIPTGIVLNKVAEPD